MKKIVIITNVNKDKDLKVTEAVVARLIDRGCEVFIHSDIAYRREGLYAYDVFPDGAELIIVVGGDGSVIDASSVAIEKNIPILGINLGKVGYLAEIELDNIALLDNLVSGKYSIVNKMLLSLEFEGSEKQCLRCAVNDVVISRDTGLSIASIKVQDSIGNAVKLRADGIILSTPQGSTAYSFSCGGPIIAHNVESILLTPLSPHSLFNRSVIFNSHDAISATNIGDGNLVINIDGRRVGSLLPGESCMVRKSEKNIKVLTFTENSMFSSLFRKMRILGDID